MLFLIKTVVLVMAVVSGASAQPPSNLACSLSEQSGLWSVNCEKATLAEFARSVQSATGIRFEFPVELELTQLSVTVDKESLEKLLLATLSSYNFVAEASDNGTLPYSRIVILGSKVQIEVGELNSDNPRDDLVETLPEVFLASRRELVGGGEATEVLSKATSQSVNREDAFSDNSNLSPIPQIDEFSKARAFEEISRLIEAQTLASAADESTAPPFTILKNSASSTPPWGIQVNIPPPAFMRLPSNK